MSNRILFSRSQGRYVREADFTDSAEKSNGPVVLTDTQIALIQKYVKLRNLRDHGDTSRRGAPGKIQEQIRNEMKKISTTIRTLPLDVQVEMEKQKVAIKS